MSSRIVYFNGRFVPELEARVPLYDSALQVGDMCFEVTRTFRGEPFRLRKHLERLFGSLAELAIESPLSLDELEGVTLETLARNRATQPPEVDWQIIHNLSRGPVAPFRDLYPPEERRPTVLVSCFPITAKLASVAAAYRAGVDLVVPRQPAIPTELLPTHIKTRGRLHYKLADLELSRTHPGAWAVLADPTGQLTEGTSNNFFHATGGEVHTPPAETVLLGVTRGVIFELCERLGITLRERRLTPDDAEAADEVFVTSTSIGLIHGRTFNGRVINRGALGPIAARLRDALDAEVGLSFEAQALECAARLAGGARPA